jgi:uncharacterized cupredoxin-like copper-binding protein
MVRPKIGQPRGIMRMKRAMKRFLMAGVVAMGCAAPSLAADGSQIVNVSLWDKDGAMGIHADTTTVKAGQVTFAVTNNSTQLVHEMIVIRDPRGKVPYDEKTGRLDEEKVKSQGEVPELPPRTFGKLTADLKPGSYLLICNQPAHFMGGMKTAFTVVP